MAGPSKQQKQQLVITCSVCGKQVLPRGDWPIPVDYVWDDGKNICMECVSHGKTNKE